jgi:hypothetical protein
MSSGIEAVLWNFNVVLTALFTLEVLIKLLGNGFWLFIQDGFNVFDFLIVAVSLVEIALVATAGLNSLR